MVSPPRPGEVSAFHAHVDLLASDPARAERALAWLTPSDQARYARFRHEDDRLMFLLGRVMARSLVGRAAGVDPRSWPWREGPRGRPEVGDPALPLHFNLAHSAGLVVCALAHSHEVGVDVEDRRRRPLDRHIVHRFCAPEEAADIDAGGDEGWHDRFLVYWTLKEAYLKARGLGIAVHLANLRLTLDDERIRLAFRGDLAGTDPRWAFHLASPTARHLVAVAAPEADGPVTFTLAPLPVEWLP